MKKYYKIISPISAGEAFAEASREELRAIIALSDNGGAPLSFEDISRLAGISLSRARSAVAFWEGSGVLKAEDALLTDGNIVEVFERRLGDSDMLDMTGVETAAEIRDANLAEVIDHCAKLMKKPVLHMEETKRIVSLSAEYGLEPGYIMALVTFMAEHSKSLTASAIFRKGKTLYDKEINTFEKLEAYIKDSEDQVSGEAEFKRAFGINHKLSSNQRELLKKWFMDYGFGLDVIGEAYDLMVNNINRVDFRYMDPIITSWHEAGCMTVADCRKKVAEDRLKKKQAADAKKPQKKKETEKPRYGNFDPDEAFARALERSYGHLNSKKDDGGQ